MRNVKVGTIDNLVAFRVFLLDSVKHRNKADSSNNRSSKAVIMGEMIQMLSLLRNFIKSELRFCTGSNHAHSMSKVYDVENL